jgi:dCTP deaminase
MRLLVDQEITTALQDPAHNALAYVMDGASAQPQQVDALQVRSASLDLTVGEIFIPGSSPDALGGSNSGKREHNLDQGHTAVIRTRELLRIGPRRAAIAFPPAHESLKGLLMTNPGHIDPGYEGPLHCTVINMGHDSYQLRRGSEIMRVLFFELDDVAQAVPIPAGLPPPRNVPNPITNELLSRLSIDFVDVEKRAQSIANKALGWATLIAAVIPIVTVLVALFGTNYFAPLQIVKDDILKLHSDLTSAATKLEEKEDIHRLDTTLDTLKVQIDKGDKFDERLKALENRVNTLPKGPQQSRNSR